MIEDMLRTNAEMREAMRALDLLLKSPSPPDRNILSNLRLRIGRAAGEHLKLIDTVICPALAMGRTEAHRSGGRDIKALMLRLYADSSQHVARWDTDKIIAEWQAYRTDVRPFFVGIEKRIEMEERVIYPLLKTL